MRTRLTLGVVAGLLLLCVPAPALPPDPLEGARTLLRAKRFAEATDAAEAYLAKNRFDGQAWSLYGVCLHMSKQFDRSITAGKKAIELGYDPANQMYNIACAYALLNQKNQAIDWIAQALDHGFTEQETLEKDDEIDGLRKDPRFIQITGLNPPKDQSTSEQWVRDLDFLTRRMEQMHWSLYAKVSQDTFHREIENLKTDAPKLDKERVQVRLTRILAMVGDGHTTLATFAEGQESISRIPLHLYLFSDGLCVIGTRKEDQRLLGAKVLKVGGLDAHAAIEKLRPFCSVDNEMTYLTVAVPKLTWPAALEEIGAATNKIVEYTLQLRDGTTEIVRMPSVAMNKMQYGRHARFRPGYVYANHGCPRAEPLYLHDLDKPLTAESLDDAKAVYFGFHQVAENKGQTFAAFIDGLTKRIEAKKAEYLIIDMRLNTGGDTGLVLPLIHALIRNDRINRPGHLFVIIGRYTFSAAQNTVNLIEMNTNATFVGEPTGSCPNFVGESTYIILPYCKLKIYCSSRYWQHVVSTDHRKWVQPQIAAEMSCGDFVENRDPCLDAIQERIKSAWVK